MHAMGKSPALPLYYLLIITLLAFYLLIAHSNAIPLSRVQRLPLQESGEMPLVRGSTAKPKMEMKRPVVVIGEDTMINERMALETQDYPPSGPNNHHKPPGWS